jgi:hypothetical protein
MYKIWKKYLMYQLPKLYRGNENYSSFCFFFGPRVWLWSSCLLGRCSTTLATSPVQDSSFHQAMGSKMWLSYHGKMHMLLHCCDINFIGFNSPSSTDFRIIGNTGSFKIFIYLFIYLLFIYSHVYTLFGSFLPPAFAPTLYLSPHLACKQYRFFLFQS